MKALFALICFLAIAAVFADEISVKCPGEITIAPSQWMQDTHQVSFRVDHGSCGAGYEVRAVRRFMFTKKNDSSIWLCPGAANCSNQGTEPDYIRKIPLTVTSMSMYYLGSDFGAVGDITIRLCDKNCTEECPLDCSNHGGCMNGAKICFCDAGLHNRGKDCISSGWDWFNLLILICSIGIVVLLALFIVVCCCCCRCCRRR